MEKYIGKSVYKGTAIGPVSVLKKKDSLVKRIHIDNTAEELKRLDAAKERTMTQLGQLYEKALQEVGEVNAAIFEVHQMMLEDDDYQDAIHNMIQNEEVNAEYAVAVTGDNFAEMFANMDDEYMQARSADVRDISNRLVRNLSGEEQIDWSTMEPSIIVADDLTPSETVQMDKSKILAFVTVHGSTNSHTAILARMMNIPALIGVPLELEKIHNGTRAIVDGREAVFYLDPEEEQLRQAEAAANWHEQTQVLILDAGHGGEDGGAVAPDGTVEADINLEIALRARAIAELTGVRVIMTRESAQIAYPDDAATVAQRKKADQHRRAELVREMDNAVLISIHQNCYPDRKPSGAQVLYAASPGSDTLGIQMHDNLVTYLDPQNRRVAAPISEKIYLMHAVQCPAVLVECGFLSNASECAKLKDADYQAKLATVIIASYLQYRQSLPQTGMIT